MDGDARETDVLVIGGGPGGYAAAIRAAQLGLDATLAEMDAYGGTCLNHGCIPSKALLDATGLAHDAANAGGMGIDADPEVDLGRMVEWKDGVVEGLTRGVERLCKGNGVTLLDGRAEFEGEHAARVVSRDGGEEAVERVAFEHAIVATGSRPVEIPNLPFDADPVLDSRAALSSTEAPDSLVVVGAGYVGMELSTVFAKLGTEVTVVEMLDSILPGYGADLARPVRRRADDLGIEFRFGRTAAGWTEEGDEIAVRTEPAGDDGGAEEALPADRVLVAVGREPVTDTVGLDAVGVGTDDRGFVETDGVGRTPVGNVFAVGDVAGEPMLAHAGMAEGEAAAEAIAGEPPDPHLDARAIPAVVFTDPEVATVGMTEDDAEEAGIEAVTGRFPFRASGRAATAGHDEGFVRVVADADSGRILGGQVVGREASELIAEVGLAVETGATLRQVAGAVHAHPTLSEAVREAAANALGRAIHTLNR